MNYNPFNLNDKTILITGASSGIGKATAIECAKLGAKIIATARKEELLKSLMNELNGTGHSYLITEMADMESIKKLTTEMPSLDGVVLCAGTLLTTPIKFCTPDKFKSIFNLNLFSNCELIRLLYKSKKINNSASIVFISSIGGMNVHSIGNAIYDASKAALNSFMKSCAREFANKLIRVNSVCPGMVNTKLIQIDNLSEEDKVEDMKKYLLKRYGEPEDIAYSVVYLLSDASSWVTGHSLVIDGGVSCI